MFVFLVCLAALTLHCEAGGIYGIISPGLYSNYDGAYASSYKNYKPYGFEYGVSDPHTGDHKHQWETKDEHGTVRGSYSLLEPDGSTRVVDYIADDHGFRAIVKKIGIHGATVESHGGAVEGSGLAATPIIAAEPVLSHVAQPVVLKQEAPLVVKQPAVYLDQGPTFHSYDGGYEDYQNLVPYHVPKAHGLVTPVTLPKQEITYTPKLEAAALPAYITPKEPIYIKQEVFAPKAEGIYHSQPGYVLPELAQTYHQAPVTYTQAPITYSQAPVSYNQAPVSYNQAPVSYSQAPVSYNQAPSVYHQEPVTYHQEPLPYHQEPVAYQAPVTYQQPEAKSYQTIQKYPVEQKLAVAAPSYEANLPTDQYQFEQTFGEPQQVWSGPTAQSGHLVAHPHGDSSQNYYGTTGNLHDDYQYSNYDQGYKQPQPYSKW